MISTVVLICSTLLAAYIVNSTNLMIIKEGKDLKSFPIYVDNNKSNQLDQPVSTRYGVRQGKGFDGNLFI